MWRGLVTAGLIAGAAACASAPAMPREEAQRQLDQMLVLFQENRPKFVLQKQEIQQEKACTRAKGLRQAADDRVKAESMSPTRNENLTMVQMELVQAERACLSR